MVAAIEDVADLSRLLAVVIFGITWIEYRESRRRTGKGEVLSDAAEWRKGTVGERRGVRDMEGA